MHDIPDHITDSSPHTDKPEADPDAAYDEERQRRIDAVTRLVSDLNIMIASIAKTNSFDKIDMDRLLKRARDQIWSSVTHDR